MKRSEAFFVFSILFTIGLFVVYRSPPVLYLGLVYSMIVAFTANTINEREIKIDPLTLMGVLLLAISPIFLVIRFGEYPSPAIFHALVLLGTSIILFTPKSVIAPNSIAMFEILLAVSVRTTLIRNLVAWTSERFVDITSYLVREMINLSNVPILMNDNTAIVRNTMIVIGSGCSGLDAFILYILASLLLIYLRKSDIREASLILLGALGIIPLNALRIFILLLIGYHSGIPFLELFHSHLGDLMFVAYVFIYWWWILKHRSKNSNHLKDKDKSIS